MGGDASIFSMIIVSVRGLRIRSFTPSSPGSKFIWGGLPTTWSYRDFVPTRPDCAKRASPSHSIVITILSNLKPVAWDYQDAPASRAAGLAHALISVATAS